jgi:hypothetical protein
MYTYTKNTCVLSAGLFFFYARMHVFYNIIYIYIWGRKRHNENILSNICTHAYTHRNGPATSMHVSCSHTHKRTCNQHACLMHTHIQTNLQSAWMSCPIAFLNLIDPFAPNMRGHFLYMYARLYMCWLMRVYIYIYIYIHICVSLCVCHAWPFSLYVCTFVHVLAYACFYIYIYIYIYMRRLMCMCLCTCM